jgi:subtilisin family serine protease
MDPPAGPARLQADTPKQFRQRQIIVTLPEATPEQWAATARALSDAYDLREAGNFPLDSLRVQCLVYDVPDDRSLERVLEELKRDPRIESVQINQVFIGVKGLHSDPYALLSYGATAIHAEQAHRMATGKGVSVAIIDTGVDKDHPDLRGRIAKTVNFVEGGELSFAQDAHGTAVAGVIGARADDGVGIYGIAPEAAMTAVKACWYPQGARGGARCSSWTLAKAIDYAIVNHAQIINMSLSGPADVLLGRLVDAAQGHGIIIVAAAAQEAQEPGFPAQVATVTAVVASNARGEVKAPSWGKDDFLLAAPGVEILTTAPRDSYDFLSGSSLAAGYVTGVVALLLQQRPSLLQREIWVLLTSTARPVTGARGVSSARMGVVDACAAVAKLLGSGDCR